MCTLVVIMFAYNGGELSGCEDGSRFGIKKGTIVVIPWCVIANTPMLTMITI